MTLASLVSLELGALVSLELGSLVSVLGLVMMMPRKQLLPAYHGEGKEHRPGLRRAETGEERLGQRP